MLQSTDLQGMQWDLATMTVERVLVKDYWVQRGRSNNNVIRTGKLKFSPSNLVFCFTISKRMYLL